MPEAALRHAGAVGDPVAALPFFRAGDVAWSVIDGRVVVEGGELATLDVRAHVERHNRIARELLV